MPNFVTPWTVARQAPLPMAFPRQEFWSRLPYPSPGDLPDPGITDISCIGRQIILSLSHLRNPLGGPSVKFSHSVLSDSLQHHELQHTRPPCPSPTPGVHPNSCPSSWWCHPAISSSVIPIRVFSNESTLRMRWPNYWSFSFTISPSNDTQDWSPLEWTGWISLQSKGLSRVFSNTIFQKHQFLHLDL